MVRPAWFSEIAERQFLRFLGTDGRANWVIYMLAVVLYAVERICGQ